METGRYSWAEMLRLGLFFGRAARAQNGWRGAAFFVPRACPDIELLATLVFLWLACTCANEVAKTHLICASCLAGHWKFCALFFLWAWL